MTDLTQVRNKHAADLIDSTRSMLDEGPLDRVRLDLIRERVQNLAKMTELWGNDSFSAPEGDELQNRYLISSEGEQGITLYLNVMRAGKKIPPHDHTTWACIAAVEGSELNTLYDRTDDGSVPGNATLAVREEIDLRPGRSVAMMPDDIHSVEIRGDQVIRHLHFYGRPLETLDARKVFDTSANTWKIMDVGVKTSHAGK